MSSILNSSKVILFRDMLNRKQAGSYKDEREKGCNFPSMEHLQILGRYAGAHDAGVGLLSLEMLDFHRIALNGGDETAFDLFDQLLHRADEMFRRHFSNCRLLFVEGYGLGESALFFEHPKIPSLDLARSYFSLRLEFEEMVRDKTVDALGEPAAVVLGYSLIEPSRRQEIPRRLVKALCEARHFARSNLNEEILGLQQSFFSLLEQQNIVPVYQPVLDFSTGSTLGWEAFARGPQGTQLYNPSTFFRFAEQIGAVYELDRKCREAAVRNLGPLESRQLLFINTHYMSLNGDSFSPPVMAGFLADYGLKPRNVVLEFSEKQHLCDSSLLRLAIEPYREMGFKIAIDDVGGGDGSLRILTQIRPDYLKLDCTLVRRVDSNPFNRLMVEVILFLAKKIDAQVIAVGLESENEFSSLASMGVRAGQGFLLSGPESVKKEVTVKLPTGATWQDALDSSWKCSKPVRDMVEKALTVAPDATVEEVKGMLDSQPPNSNVVVLDGRRPIGQVMSYNLDRRLGARYGISLYLHREVSHLMNSYPLIVDGGQSVEEVAKLAMKRQGPQIYDDIIVTEGGDLAGVVSVQRLLDYLAQFQVELAKGSNPLTGLPGNLAIEHEIERRIKAKISSSLIYLDLDNFKVYNDVYGFGKGDQVILLTSNILQKALKQVGSPQDFVGHVGGDDFIIISTHDSAEPIGVRIISFFQKEIPEFYTDEHRQAGHVVAVGRDGIRREFPFVSVSIGIVDFEFDQEFTLADLSNRAAMIKKYAKSKWGNSCVRDRRSPLGAKPGPNAPVGK